MRQHGVEADDRERTLTQATSPASLAIVIVSFNTASLLRQCLQSIREWGNETVSEVIVVDNQSCDDSVDLVRREFPDVRVLAQSANLGFGAANNVGVAASTSRYVMLLNSDAVLLEDTGGGLIRYLEQHPDVSCVGPLVLLPDGRPQPRVHGHQPSLWRVAMQSLGLGAVFKRVSWLAGTDGGTLPGPADEVGWISGVCMVMRRADFLKVGGFDPRIFMYCEDIELCGRLAEAIGPVVRLDHFGVRHFGGASSPTLPDRVRSAVWAQRNLLSIVRDRSGPATAALTKVLLSMGLLLRIGAGLSLVPRKGIVANHLLRTSFSRMRDLVGSGF